MICPFCQVDTLEPEDSFCTNCGNVALPVNECSECGETLGQDACYCNRCGNKSLYFENDLVKPVSP